MIILRELIIVQNVEDHSILINGGELNNLLILFEGNNNFSKNNFMLRDLIVGALRDVLIFIMQFKKYLNTT